MVRGGHTQEGSRNTPLARLTGHFHSNTHTISVRDWKHLTDISVGSPSPSHPSLFSFPFIHPISPPFSLSLLLSLYPSSSPPLPSLATPSLPLPSPLLLSLYPSPFTSQSSLSSSENSSSLFCQSQFKAPVSSNHQESGRLQEGQGEEGGSLLDSKFNIVDPRSVVQGWWSAWIDSSYAHLV